MSNLSCCYCSLPSFERTYEGHEQELLDGAAACGGA